MIFNYLEMVDFPIHLLYSTPTWLRMWW